jgi:hypothetical protein
MFKLFEKMLLEDAKEVKLTGMALLERLVAHGDICPIASPVVGDTDLRSGIVRSAFMQVDLISAISKMLTSGDVEVKDKGKKLKLLIHGELITFSLSPILTLPQRTLYQ